MHADQVRDLVAYVNEEWRPWSDDPPATPEPDPDASPPAGGQWVSYWPLGSPVPLASIVKPMTGFRFVIAVAVRTSIVICFRWVPDHPPREYLLPVDLSERPAEPAGERWQPTSAFLFESALRLVALEDWTSKHTIPLSTTMALVPPWPSGVSTPMQ